jgi:hypothetical protein
MASNDDSSGDVGDDFDGMPELCRIPSTQLSQYRIISQPAFTTETHTNVNEARAPQNVVDVTTPNVIFAIVLLSDEIIPRDEMPIHYALKRMFD